MWTIKAYSGWPPTELLWERPLGNSSIEPILWELVDRNGHIPHWLEKRDRQRLEAQFHIPLGAGHLYGLEFVELPEVEHLPLEFEDHEELDLSLEDRSGYTG